MSTRATIIDAYARTKNYYSWIDYHPVGQDIVDEVERQGENGLYLSTACALLEKESGFKNLFGCDWGSKWTETPPYCQVAVTKDRVRKLIENVENGGGQNGIGYCQLTTISYVYEAEKMGGAHVPKYNMRVGFRVLLDHILNLGWPAGAAAFNAGAGNWRAVMDTYGADMKRLEREWAARLAEADDEEHPARRYEVKLSRRMSHLPTARRVAEQIKTEVNLPRNMEVVLVDHEFEEGDMPDKKKDPRWSSDGKHKWRGYTPWVVPKKSGSYIDKYPTHTTWARKAEETAIWIERNYPNTTVTTYYDHPPAASGFRQFEYLSLDIWGNDNNAGTHDRGYKLDPKTGEEIWTRLWRGDGPGHLWNWAIYRGRGWSRNGGLWTPEEDSFSDGGHHFHYHLTLLA